MARYFPMEGYDLKWIWNVTYAVGPGCSNRPDDVQLVQHAFNTLMGQIEFFDGKGALIKSYLKRDGLYGSKTETAIRAFQNWLISKKRYVTADGVVSPSHQTGYTKKDTIYTIVYFNRVHRDCYGKMMDEAEFPSPLKQVATASSATGGKVLAKV